MKTLSNGVDYARSGEAFLAGHLPAAPVTAGIADW